MESADLRVFQMVAREGSVTKAAGRLGYVQSNITARIQQLESELQTVLFFRHNRGMSLTSNGKTLLTYADKIVGLLDEAVLALSTSAEPSGPLMIGSTQTAAAVRLPKLLAFYYEKHSNVQLSLRTGHSQYLIEKVLHYELDGAFIGCSCTHPDLQSITAFEEELVVAAGPNVASLTEALMKPILVFSTGCSYREILEQWLQSIGKTQPMMMEFGMLEAIIGGVSAGLGISLMPKAVTKKHEAEGLIRTFEIPQPYRYIKTEFITRKDAFVSSSLSAFLGMLPGTAEV
ncbi:LysR family transcriptional regulator [Paenibacillus aceris]|uniref:DNA-binding transcriptional LysR family regulator n=1 Tax=Paenibacillus aceris TaxID=869555 RepID=A0ABS4HY62_9BACL|nr:LysR family transcriptional regulator [Paenibacillus aceris]MBP1963601.1 DNA-binding transcriptional LysR family regulator [Paenibacillus aceris]NHW36862.1 LysR family transcriptional regulator [Paenibacillus aceris]